MCINLQVFHFAICVDMTVFRVVNTLRFISLLIITVLDTACHLNVWDFHGPDVVLLGYM